MKSSAQAPLVPFPTLAVKVRDLRRMLASGAPPARVRSQLARIRYEHRRRLGQALHAVNTLKPECIEDLQPMWKDTLDSAILLLHMNARDFQTALRKLSDTRRCGRA